jgi:hypothetical protein
VNVYSPPSRPFANPPAVNPMRSTFASPPAQFAPRTFAPSPAPRTFAPSPPFRQTFTPPMHASPPPQRFSAPIGGGGGFSRPGGGAPFGGGAHFGGGHRR